eukprot:Em0021g138a
MFRTIVLLFAFYYGVGGIRTTSYTITANATLRSQGLIVADARTANGIRLTCTASSTDAGLVWEIDGNPLTTRDWQGGVISAGPYIDLSNGSKWGILDVPTRYSGAKLRCGEADKRIRNSSSMTVVWIRRQPSLLGYPKLEAATAIGSSTLRCSWIGSADDFIDYYTATITSRTALLLEKNTTELSAAVTMPIACGVTYECSVVATNMLGQGKASSVQTVVPCPTTQATPRRIPWTPVNLQLRPQPFEPQPPWQNPWLPTQSDTPTGTKVQPESSPGFMAPEILVIREF